jgi:methyl-accepting chemotaxis protein
VPAPASVSRPQQSSLEIVWHSFKRAASPADPLNPSNVGQGRAIQEATGSSAQAIENIAQTINRVSEISTAIAGAVEEQGAATLEIARNAQQAAQGTAEVSSNTSGVTQASQQTSASSTQVLSAASELAKNSEKLRQEVETFLQAVRAA